MRLNNLIIIYLFDNFAFKKLIINYKIHLVSIQKTIKLIFDKMILEDIDVIKNYKYFENEKLLVLYVDAADSANDKYFEFDIPNQSNIMNMYEEIYEKYSKEYDEDGSLIDSVFIGDYLYEENYVCYKTEEDEFLFNLSNYVTKCLKYVGLQDLNISVYINCEK